MIKPLMYDNPLPLLFCLIPLVLPFSNTSISWSRGPTPPVFTIFFLCYNYYTVPPSLSNQTTLPKRINDDLILSIVFSLTKYVFSWHD